jgi:hypothetical protein
MIQTTTTATISVAMTQFMTITAHIVANAWRYGRTAAADAAPLDPGRIRARVAAEPLFPADFGAAPSRGAASVIS